MLSKWTASKTTTLVTDIAKINMRKFTDKDRELCLPVMEQEKLQAMEVSIPEGIEPILPALQGIKAVLFDVYGTLFTSAVGDISLSGDNQKDALLRKIICEHFNLQEKTLPKDLDSLLRGEILKAQQIRKTEGVSYPEVEIREIWQDFLTQLKIKPNLHDICALVTRYECLANPCYPMPYLEEILRNLHDSGYLLGIISNAQFYTQALFMHFLGKWPEDLGFSPELCFWSYHFLEGKPSRIKYKSAASVLKDDFSVDSDQVLYIGNDMRNDILPANEVGFHTALFAGDSRSLRLREDDNECRGLKPTSIITDLSQIQKNLLHQSLIF